MKTFTMCMLMVAVALACVGCTTSEHLGTFGEGPGALEVHSAYSRVAGAPAITTMVTVNQGQGRVVGMFSQTDMASLGVEGVLGAGQSALSGMTFGMFRKPDRYESNISAGNGDVDVSAGGGDATSGSASSATGGTGGSATGGAGGAGGSGGAGGAGGSCGDCGGKDHGKDKCKEKKGHKHQKGKGHDGDGRGHDND